MAEQSTVFITTQIGVEATPGTAVPANKQLLAVAIEPAIKTKIQTFRPRGQKYNTVAVLGEEWTESKVSGPAAYNDLTYLFASHFAYAAPTQINVSAGLAYQWNFNPGQTAADTVKTYTVQSGSAVRAQQIAYGILNEFGYTLTREKFDISGTMLGQAISDGITLTASPTAITLVPIQPSTVDVFLDATSGGIGTTKLLRATSLDYKKTNRFGPVWALNSANGSFATHTEMAPKPELKLLVEADAQGMALLTTMRNGSKEFLRVKATGAQIDASPTPASYTFQHDMCLEVTNVSEFKDEQGIYAIEWTFEVSYDSGWGASEKVELINVLSTL